MNAKRTLLFMSSNPVPFIGYLLACWVFMSASITMSDDPFTYGTLPDAVAAADGAFANLPGSLWKLVTALSIIIEEIVSDFYYSLCLFAIPFALIFTYREARSSLKGIATERQMWVQWYDRQQLVKAQQGTYETPPLSEYTPGGSYFISARKTGLFMFRHLMLPTGHFVCWIFVFALPTLFETSDFVGSLPEIIIPAVIFTLILSYREARSNLKGMAIERGIWTKWYHQQTKAIAQEGTFEEPPSLDNRKNYFYFGEIPETLLFMLRNLKPFIIHLTCWVFTYALLFFTTLPPSKTPEDIFEIFEVIGIFGQLLPWIVIIAFVISYREARGNLKGIADEQQVWMRWYQEQQEARNREKNFEELSLSENRQVDSYFKVAQKTILSMLRNPLSVMVHLICWFAAFIFLFGGILSFELLLFGIIAALISSYQEARGNVKGVAKEREVWTKWYQRQIEAKAQGYALAEVPPAINVR